MIRALHILIPAFVAITGLMSLTASAQMPDEALATIKPNCNDVLTSLLAVKL